MMPSEIQEQVMDSTWLHTARPRSMISDLTLLDGVGATEDERVDHWIATHDDLPGGPGAWIPRDEDGEILAILGAAPGGVLLVLTDEWFVGQGIRYARIWARDKGNVYSPLWHEVRARQAVTWSDPIPKITDAMRAQWKKAKPMPAAVLLSLTSAVDAARRSLPRPA